MMENDERYLILKGYALGLHNDTSVDPRKLSIAISSAEDVFYDERNINSPNRLDLGELMNLGMAMRAKNHYLRGEKDKARHLMERDEAEQIISDYTEDERTIFQSYGTEDEEEEPRTAA